MLLVVFSREFDRKNLSSCKFARLNSLVYPTEKFYKAFVTILLTRLSFDAICKVD